MLSLSIARCSTPSLRLGSTSGTSCPSSQPNPSSSNARSDIVFLFSPLRRFAAFDPPPSILPKAHGQLVPFLSMPGIVLKQRTKRLDGVIQTFSIEFKCVPSGRLPSPF